MELGVADSVEFDFFGMFVENAEGVAETFGGEDVMVAADFDYFPKGVEQRRENPGGDEKEVGLGIPLK